MLVSGATLDTPECAEKARLGSSGSSSKVEILCGR